METTKKPRISLNWLIYFTMIGFSIQVFTAHYVSYQPFTVSKEISVIIGTLIAGFYILILREVRYFASSHRYTWAVYAFFVITMATLASFFAEEASGVILVATIVVVATCVHPRYGVAALLTFVLLGLWLTAILLPSFLVVLAAGSVVIIIVGMLRHMLISILPSK